MAYDQISYARNSGANLIGQHGVVAEIVIDTDDYSIVVRDGSTSGGPAAPAKINAYIPTPQGRLTLTSGAPVMTADVTAGTTVYYDPYVGQYCPIYDGSYFRSVKFSEINIGLASGVQLSGKLYDLFGFLVSGALTLGTGPAWTNGTTRSAAISLFNGVWTNTASITLSYGASSASTVTVGANQATYLGTIYCTANGQTQMQFQPAPAAGGNGTVLGLWNAYNRVRVPSRSGDSTSSWTYTTAAWRAADNSSSNRITFVDGLGQSPFSAEYNVGASTSANTVTAFIGIALDGATPNTSGAGSNFCFQDGTQSTVEVTLQATMRTVPQLGLHFVQAAEYCLSGGTATFSSLTWAAVLFLMLDM